MWLARPKQVSVWVCHLEAVRPSSERWAVSGKPDSASWLGDANIIWLSDIATIATMLVGVIRKCQSQNRRPPSRAFSVAFCPRNSEPLASKLQNNHDGDDDKEEAKKKNTTNTDGCSLLHLIN